MDCSSLRILFAGNPHIAVPSLRTLAERFTVVGVLTNPDRPSGRGRKVELQEVKIAAQELGIPVFQFETIRGEARTQIAAVAPNFLVSFACGYYFGPRFLSLFPHGAINIHPSLLPRHRGCAPIQSALLAKDSETGITIQRIVEDLDCGDILSVRNIPLTGEETGETLSTMVASLAASQLISTIESLCSGTIVELSQDSTKATYSSLLSKEDGLINWNSCASDIHAKIRAYYPWPKAHTTYNGIPLIITSVYGSLFEAGTEPNPEGVIPGTVVALQKGKGLAVACSDGLLYINRLQLAQRKELDYLSFKNGNPHIIGSILGT